MVKSSLQVLNFWEQEPVQVQEKAWRLFLLVSEHLQYKEKNLSELNNVRPVHGTKVKAVEKDHVNFKSRGKHTKVRTDHDRSRKILDGIVHMRLWLHLEQDHQS